jgi:hypothetical protein
LIEQRENEGRDEVETYADTARNEGRGAPVLGKEHRYSPYCGCMYCADYREAKGFTPRQTQVWWLAKGRRLGP